VGSGTMLAGLATGSRPHQQITGIAVVKDPGLENAISALLDPGQASRINLIHDYHFGGFARAPAILISFMNEWYRRTAIPSDLVYTGKLFYALDDLVRKNYFRPGSRVLVIHSGGLQGNRSLPKGTLIF